MRDALGLTLPGRERARAPGTCANLRAKEKIELTARLAKSRCERQLEARGWHGTRTPDCRQDHSRKAKCARTILLSEAVQARLAWLSVSGSGPHRHVAP